MDLVCRLLEYNPYIRIHCDAKCFSEKWLVVRLSYYYLFSDDLEIHSITPKNKSQVPVCATFQQQSERRQKKKTKLTELFSTFCDFVFLVLFVQHLSTLRLSRRTPRPPLYSSYSHSAHHTVLCVAAVSISCRHTQTHRHTPHIYTLT